MNRPAENAVTTRTITVRKPTLDLDAPAPRYWWDDSPAITCFAYAMSAAFPVGERFFVRTVHQVKDQVRDPALLAEMRGFMGQEGQHANTHERYNQRAEAEGFPVSRITANLQKGASRVTRWVSVPNQLALTAAFEHFTAMASWQMLGGERIMDRVASPHRELWLWHAAEELEHKAVAFDVYMAVDGSYLRRAFAYLVATLSMGLMTLFRTWFLMYADGSLFVPRHHWTFVRWLLWSPGLARILLWRWVDYLRPGFHPWQHDDQALLLAWRREWDSHSGAA